MDEGYDAVNIARALRHRGGTTVGRSATRGDGDSKAAGRGRHHDRCERDDRRERHDGRDRSENPSSDGTRHWRRTLVLSRHPPLPARLVAALAQAPRSGHARDVGRRPGPRHAHAPRPRPGRHDPVARPTDLDRRRPPRGPVLLRPLSPAAFLTGGDSPLAVVSRSPCRDRRGGGDLVAGQVDRRSRRGLVAGLAMAISSSAIDKFDVDPEPEPDRPVECGRPGRRLARLDDGPPGLVALAAVGTALTMQFHVLGVTLLPIVGGAAPRRCRADRPGRSDGGSGDMALAKLC